jgi:hypothetical protein
MLIASRTGHNAVQKAVPMLEIAQKPVDLKVLSGYNSDG